MRPITAILALILTGCAKPRPPEPPAPPAIDRSEPTTRTYPKQTAKPGDMWIHGCTVTKEEGNRADCLCKKASTKIDVKDQTKQSLICR